MIKRFYYSLLKPSRIALFIKDNIFLSLLYFLFFLVLSICPSIVKHINSNNDISSASFNYIYNQIPENNKLVFSNNKLIIDTKFMVKDPDYNCYYFGDVEAFNTNTVSFVLKEDNYTIYNNGKIFGTFDYSKLNVSDFSLEKIKTSSQDYYSFKSLFSAIYNTHFRYQPIEYSVTLFVSELFDMLFAGLIFYMIAWVKSPFLTSRHKLNITIYSLTYTFIGLFLDAYFGLDFLVYIFFIPSIVCLFRALSVIKVVKIPRGE